MSQQTIICPHCRKEITLAEAVQRELRETLEKEIREQIQADNASDLAKLRQELEIEKGKRVDAEQKELAVRKEREQLQTEKESWELTKQRQIDAERNTIRQTAFAQAQIESDMKVREKEELIKGLTAEINNLKQKAEQGSQQAQGEVQEIIIEDFLKSKFCPQDKILPVPKGVRGADILQEVHDDYNYHCGTIIWESKRTKAWGNDWCGKLKDDQQLAKADIAILVSQVLPDEVTNFGYFNGIWVSTPAYILGLATALRAGLVEVSRARRSLENRGSKIDDLYNYLTSADFGCRVKAIVDYFSEMRDDLEKEKKAIQKQWKKRETQIEKVTEKTMEIRGVLEAIIGKPMILTDGTELKALMPRVEEDEEIFVQ